MANLPITMKVPVTFTIVDENPDSISFKYHGKVKPYVRMTQRSKHVNKQALEYLASQQEIRLRLREYMNLTGTEMFPDKTPLEAVITLSVPERLHTCDSDNLIKAILDAAQGVAFHNDMWIDKITFKRTLGAAHVFYLHLGVV